MTNQQTVIVAVGLTSVIAIVGVLWFLRKRQADENEDEKETDVHENDKQAVEEDVFLVSNEDNLHTAPDIDLSELIDTNNSTDSFHVSKDLVDETVVLLENVGLQETPDLVERENGLPLVIDDNISTREARIAVPEHIVGIIIGKGGCNIKELRREFDLSLDFEADVESPKESSGQKVKILKVSGDTQKVSLAEARIQEIIAAHPKYVEEEMFIPQEAVGRVIGRGGKSVEEITKTSGARIQIDKTSKDGQQRIKLVGTPVKVEHARRLIEEKVNPRLGVKQSSTQSCKLYGQKNRSLAARNFPCVEVPDTTDYFQVFVSAFDTPDHLWIQLVSPESAKLDELTETMSQYCASLKADEGRLEKGSVGDICIAPFEHDSQWYRACVTDVGVDRKVGLYYIDFGDTGRINIDELKAAKAEYLTLPAQAIECCLPIIPSDVNWSDAAYQDFDTISHCAQWIPLMAKVIDHKESTVKTYPVLELIDTNGDKEVNVALEMIKRGDAIEPFQDKVVPSPVIGRKSYVEESTLSKQSENQVKEPLPFQDVSFTPSLPPTMDHSDQEESNFEREIERAPLIDNEEGDEVETHLNSSVEQILDNNQAVPKPHAELEKHLEMADSEQVLDEDDPLYSVLQFQTSFDSSLVEDFDAGGKIDEATLNSSFPTSPIRASDSELKFDDDFRPSLVSEKDPTTEKKEDINEKIHEVSEDVNVTITEASVNEENNIDSTSEVENAAKEQRSDINVGDTMKADGSLSLANKGIAASVESLGSVGTDSTIEEEQTLEDIEHSISVDSKDDDVFTAAGTQIQSGKGDSDKNSDRILSGSSVAGDESFVDLSVNNAISAVVKQHIPSTVSENATPYVSSQNNQGNQNSASNTAFQFPDIKEVSENENYKDAEATSGTDPINIPSSNAVNETIDEDFQGNLASYHSLSHSPESELQKSLEETSRKNVFRRHQDSIELAMENPLPMDDYDMDSMELARGNPISMDGSFDSDTDSFMTARSNVTLSNIDTDTDTMSTDTMSYFSAMDRAPSELSVSIPEVSISPSPPPEVIEASEAMRPVSKSSRSSSRSSLGSDYRRTASPTARRSAPPKFEIQFIDEKTNKVVSREALDASFESSLTKSVSRESIGKETTV